MQMLGYYIRRLVGVFGRKTRFIIDRERKLGNFELKSSDYRTDLNKEEVARRHILERDGAGMAFLDVGARDGQLTYLLGIKGNLDFDSEFYQSNLEIFQHKYDYFGMDLHPSDQARVLSGDACSREFLAANQNYVEFFDVIYSNNVFEHFERPWIAAENLEKMLKPGGLLITIVPFSQRYHESPGDYFRYTHKGVGALFRAVGDFVPLEEGYDIQGRRINWQGLGEANDIVPVDKFGAWRETWFSVSVLAKSES